MRQDKRRVPVDHSPRKSGSQPFLVFSRNPHWKHSAAILRKVDFAIPIMKKGSEDKPHASFFLWKRFLCHICEGFNGSTGMLTCEPVAELQQKTQSTQVSGVSLLAGQEGTCLQQETLPHSHGLILFHGAKIRHN